MIPCWQAEILYECEGGTTKRMKSKPTTYTRAKEQLAYYERRGFRGNLVEIASETERQLRSRRPDCAYDGFAP